VTIPEITYGKSRSVPGFGFPGPGSPGFGASAFDEDISLMHPLLPVRHWMVQGWMRAMAFDVTAVGRNPDGYVCDGPYSIDLVDFAKPERVSWVRIKRFLPSSG
jgi:hypothetical protein